MAILVTGANGMVGQHVINFLNTQGASYIASSLNKPKNISAQINWVKWDLQDSYSPNEFSEQFGSVDAIFHVGALVPRTGSLNNEQALFDINVRACQSIALWACEKEIPLIYLSGAIVYQDPFKPFQQETDSIEYSGMGGFYGYSKYLAEKVLQYYAENGLKLTILRAPSIYGYGLSSDKMLMKFLNTAIAGKTISLAPPVDDAINLLHAHDVAIAIWNAYQFKALGVYNIAYSKEYSLYDIAKTCVDVANIGKIEIQSQVNNSISPRIKFSLNIQKAQKAFDFNPKIDLYTGMKCIATHSFGI